MTLRLDTLPVELLIKISAYLTRTDLLSLSLVNAELSAGSSPCLWSSIALRTETQLESLERSIGADAGWADSVGATQDGPRVQPGWRGTLCHVTSLHLLCSALKTQRILRVFRVLGTQLLALRLGLGPEETECWTPSLTEGTVTPAEGTAVTSAEGTAWQSIVEADREKCEPASQAETLEVVSATCANLRELEIRGPCRAADVPDEVRLVQAICRRAPFLRKLYLENVRISTNDVLMVVKMYSPGQLIHLGLRPVPFLEGSGDTEGSSDTTVAQSRGNHILINELRALLRDGLRFLALVGWGAGFLDLLVENVTAKGGQPQSASAETSVGASHDRDLTRGPATTAILCRGPAWKPGLPLLRHLSVALFHPNEVEYLAQVASRGCLYNVTELTLRGMPTWGDGQVHVSRLLAAISQLRRLNLPALRSGAGHILSAIMPHIHALESLVVGGPIRTNPALSNLGAASAISNSRSSRTLAFVEFESSDAGDEITTAALVRGCPNLACIAVDYSSRLAASSLCSPPSIVRSVTAELGGLHRPTPVLGASLPCRFGGTPSTPDSPAAGPSTSYFSSPMSLSPFPFSIGESSPVSWAGRSAERTSSSLVGSHSYFVSTFANPGHDDAGYQISGRDRLERARMYGEEVERLAVRAKEEHIAKINSEHRRKNSRQRSLQESPGL